MRILFRRSLLLFLGLLLEASAFAQDEPGVDPDRHRPNLVQCVKKPNDFNETAGLICMLGTPFVFLFFGWVWYSSKPAPPAIRFPEEHDEEQMGREP